MWSEVIVIVSKQLSTWVGWKLGERFFSLTDVWVKMAGYWPSSFLFVCVFMDREGVEVHKLAKEQGQYPAILTVHTWSIKEL